MQFFLKGATIMIKKMIKKMSPGWLIASRRNCGGFNSDTSLFAGRLAEKSINDVEWLQLVNALIFYNGVRKSTKFFRNAPIIEKLFSERAVSWERSPLNVLDIGASVGIDALGNLEAIQKFTTVKKYVLGDLFTELHYDVDRQLIFDQDDRLLQILFDDYFVNLNFEFKYHLEPLFHVRNIIKTKRMRRSQRVTEASGGERVIIPLVYPPVEKNPVFEASRINVFEPLTDKFDLIICMNLLQTRYFSRNMIELGNRNLISALSPGGYLITGVTDNYRIIGARDDNSIIDTGRNELLDSQTDS